MRLLFILLISSIIASAQCTNYVYEDTNKTMCAGDKVKFQGAVYYVVFEKVKFELFPRVPGIDCNTLEFAIYMGDIKLLKGIE